MKKLPIILIYSRVLLGVIIALIAFSNPKNSGYTIVTLLFLGILTDVFDGVIARKLKVDTERIRTLDSNVDMFFWGISLISIFGINMEFVIQNLALISIVVSLELIAYLVSYTKFKKTIATHTYLAKAWSILLLLFLSELVLTHESYYFFNLVIWIGVISRLEIILILSIAKQWVIDIPSVFSLKLKKLH